MSGVSRLRSTCRLFILSCAHLVANGHNIIVMNSGQYQIECNNIVLQMKVKSLIFLSDIPFWWWAPTPQNVQYCLQSLHSFIHADSENLPLSACYCSTLTPRTAQQCSKSFFAASVDSAVRSLISATNTYPVYSTTTVQAHILDRVKLPFSCGKNPGCADIVWSTRTYCPVFVSSYFLS